MSAKDINLKTIAENVGHTSRASCGACHFYGGEGDGIKHGDISSALLNPDRSCDIHMGEYDFTCVECHKSENHKIYGRSSSVPVTEGVVSCSDCHSDTPHNLSETFDYHLNEHCKTIDCNTCHTPLYAKCKPTKIWGDWSKAGDKKRKPKKDKYEQPDYNPKKGELKWEKSVKPSYAWFNGYMNRIFIGDKVNINREIINITSPVGSVKDPNSKITPFKIMKGVQAVDAENKYFLIPHLCAKDKNDTTAYWKNFDWDKSFTEGMKTAGLDYSGQYKWVETWMYWRIAHEVMPADSALSCVDCHQSLKNEKTCNKCHKNQEGIDFKKIANKGIDFEYMEAAGRDVGELKDKTDYINFKSLGYEGDPIIYGGRFKKLPLKE